jgi:phosphatidylglycerophosphatase A
MFGIKSMELAGASVWRKPVILLATGFGLGLAPVASGTAGTLPGILILLALAPLWSGSVLWQIVVAAVLCLLAVPICDVAERHFGKKDDGRIVADEYLTFPVCMIGLPLVPWMLAVAFITCRVFDVLKPPPARQFQALPGGLGIVADDVMSNLYCLALNHLIYAGVVRYWL